MDLNLIPMASTMLQEMKQKIINLMILTLQLMRSQVIIVILWDRMNGFEWETDDD